MPLQVQSADGHEASNCYAEIPLLEDQRQHVPRHILAALGVIFLNHKTHNSFGISLLHRHFDLQSNMVMVHSRAEGDKDLCLPRKYHKSLTPCLYSLSKSQQKLVPLEYEETSAEGPSPLPSEAFVTDLASFLSEHGLANVLGLCRVSPLEQPWIEHLTLTGTLAMRSEEEVRGPECIATQWAFLFTDQELYIKTTRGCKNTVSGVHEPTKD